MKIRIAVVVDKVVEAPDFLRPYFNKELDWADLQGEDEEAYVRWYEDLIQKHTILDDGEWVIVKEDV
jgi:hypothetical protein